MEATNLMAEYDDPLAQRAAFAQRFKGTTNLDQRRRYAQDISEAKDRQTERDQADFEKLQLNNPEVGRMVTGRMAEERQNRESIVRSNLAQDRFAWDQERTSRIEDLNERKLKLQQRQEDRMLRKTETELKDAERFELDTDAFERGEEELRAEGFLPGSSQYREGITNLAARHPYVDPQWRRGVIEGARIQLDADEFQSLLADLSANNPGASFTVGPDGRPTIRQPATKPSVAPKIDVGRLDKLTKEEAELGAIEKPNAAERKRLGYVQNEIAAIDKQRQAVAGVKTTPSPSTDFTSPEDFTKAFQSAPSGTELTYKGKKWLKP